VSFSFLFRDSFLVLVLFFSQNFINKYRPNFFFGFIEVFNLLINDLEENFLNGGRSQITIYSLKIPLYPGGYYYYLCYIPYTTTPLRIVISFVCLGLIGFSSKSPTLFLARGYGGAVSSE
jgi:hypothetical protein